MLGIVLVKAILERLGLVVGVHRILRNVEVSEGHAQGASYGEHADVVAGKLNDWPRLRRNSSDARCSASNVLADTGKASRARASTVGDSSSSATRPTSSRAASPCEWARSRACSRVQISYSSNRLATSVSVQSEAGGRRSSANRCGALRTYRGRSTCASILPQFREKLVQRCDGWGCRRRGGRGRDWWCEPAVPHCIGQHRIGQQRAPRRVRGTELGHYPVTVRDKNGFA